MYKVIVAGSRNFNDFNLLEQTLFEFLKDYRPDQVDIVSGAAKGADTLGEQFAHKHGCKLTRMPADWNRQPDGSYDKSAGYRRNVDMANYADACVVFMERGGTKGSQHMINIAREKELDLFVQYYDV